MLCSVSIWRIPQVTGLDTVPLPGAPLHIHPLPNILSEIKEFHTDNRCMCDHPSCKIPSIISLNGSGNFSSNISWLWNVLLFWVFFFFLAPWCMNYPDHTPCSVSWISHLDCHNHLPLWALGAWKYWCWSSWDLLLNLNLILVPWPQNILSWSHRSTGSG